MPIYLDVQGAQSRDSGHRGIGRYVLELAGAIERSEHAAAIAGYVINPDLRVPPASRRSIPAGRLLSSADIEFRPGDVYHLTSPFEDVALDRVWPPAARIDGVRLVVTVFDLIPLMYPEHYLPNPAYHARYKNRVELIRLADRVLAISHATARDIVGDPSPAGRGVGASPAPACRRASSPPAWGAIRWRPCRRACRPCVPTTSFTRARSTSARTSTACSSPTRGSARPAHAAPARDRLAALVSRIRRTRPRLRALDMTRDVVVASGVDDDDLVPLYQAARLFVFPSLYEGFGLPVAEAIACGTPTIASDVSSLVEIVSDPAGTLRSRRIRRACG